MKKTILTAIALTCAVGAFAQGTVIFNNRVAGTIVTHVFNGGSTQLRGTYAGDTPSGTTFPTNGLSLVGGAGFWSSLLGGPLGTAEGSLLAGTIAAPVAGSGAAATSFRTGAAAGFIAGSTATFNNIAPDSASATFEMVAWDNTSGNYSTWALASAAWQQGLIAGGTSGEFNVSAIGGVLNPAPTLNGLQSFNIYMIPEPTTIALAGLGAAAVLIFRRRK